MCIKISLSETSLSDNGPWQPLREQLKGVGTSAHHILDSVVFSVVSLCNADAASHAWPKCERLI